MKKYKIIVDGKEFLVRQYVTGGQIKRLAGCDNEYYHTGFHYDKEFPEVFKVISNNEIIDLADPSREYIFKTYFDNISI
jgi:hypothetical protein